MLTQAEIDALLNGSIEIEEHDGQGSINLAELMGNESASPSAPKEAGDSSNKKIQAYNFWSPDRFSKDQMRAVELVHEDLAERLTTTLPTFLRTNVKPRMVHTEQGRFHDFINDLSPSTLYHLITMAPLPSQMVLTISPNVCFMILEQLLGGKIEQKIVERPLTDIDQSLLRGLIENMLNDIKASWSKVVSIEPTLEDSTTNQHWVQMFLGNERVMLITFEVAIQNVSGTMNIYIPFSTLKPIGNDLNPHVWISGKKEQITDLEARATIMDNVSRTYVPVTVNLGKAILTLREIVELGLNDVIPLNTRIDQDLEVSIAGQNKFYGRIGRINNKLAIRVTGAISPEQS
jgi:flagellar motor switch protein FliM